MCKTLISAQFWSPICELHHWPSGAESARDLGKCSEWAFLPPMPRPHEHPHLRGLQVLVILWLLNFKTQFSRRPIEERVVTALGKHWHIEHFACAKCEKPFLGNRHYERKGLAYCATHYHQVSLKPYGINLALQAYSSLHTIHYGEVAMGRWN